jgi:hypothetical protein
MTAVLALESLDSFGAPPNMSRDGCDVDAVGRSSAKELRTVGVVESALALSADIRDAGGLSDSE